MGVKNLWIQLYEIEQKALSVILAVLKDCVDTKKSFFNPDELKTYLAEQVFKKTMGWGTFSMHYDVDLQFAKQLEGDVGEFLILTDYDNVRISVI